MLYIYIYKKETMNIVECNDVSYRGVQRLAKERRSESDVGTIDLRSSKKKLCTYITEKTSPPIDDCVSLSYRDVQTRADSLRTSTGVPIDLRSKRFALCDYIGKHTRPRRSGIDEKKKKKKMGEETMTDTKKANETENETMKKKKERTERKGAAAKKVRAKKKVTWEMTEEKNADEMERKRTAAKKMIDEMERKRTAAKKMIEEMERKGAAAKKMIEEKERKGAAAKKMRAKKKVTWEMTEEKTADEMERKRTAAKKMIEEMERKGAAAKKMIEEKERKGAAAKKERAKKKVMGERNNKNKAAKKGVSKKVMEERKKNKNTAILWNPKGSPEMEDTVSIPFLHFFCDGVIRDDKGNLSSMTISERTSLAFIIPALDGIDDVKRVVTESTRTWSEIEAWYHSVFTGPIDKSVSVYQVKMYPLKHSHLQETFVDTFITPGGGGMPNLWKDHNLREEGTVVDVDKWIIRFMDYIMTNTGFSLDLTKGDDDIHLFFAAGTVAHEIGFEIRKKRSSTQCTLTVYNSGAGLINHPGGADEDGRRMIAYSFTSHKDNIQKLLGVLVWHKLHSLNTDIDGLYSQIRLAGWTPVDNDDEWRWQQPQKSGSCTFWAVAYWVQRMVTLSGLGTNIFLELTRVYSAQLLTELTGLRDVSAYRGLVAHIQLEPLEIAHDILEPFWSLPGAIRALATEFVRYRDNRKRTGGTGTPLGVHNMGWDHGIDPTFAWKTAHEWVSGIEELIHTVSIRPGRGLSLVARVVRLNEDTLGWTRKPVTSKDIDDVRTYLRSTLVDPDDELLEGYELLTILAAYPFLLHMNGDCATNPITPFDEVLGNEAYVKQLGYKSRNDLLSMLAVYTEMKKPVSKSMKRRFRGRLDAQDSTEPFSGYTDYPPLRDSMNNDFLPWDWIKLSLVLVSCHWWTHTATRWEQTYYITYKTWGFALTKYGHHSNPMFRLVPANRIAGFGSEVTAPCTKEAITTAKGDIRGDIYRLRRDPLQSLLIPRAGRTRGFATNKEITALGARRSLPRSMVPSTYRPPMQERNALWEELAQVDIGRVSYASYCWCVLVAVWLFPEKAVPWGAQPHRTGYSARVHAILALVGCEKDTRIGLVQPKALFPLDRQNGPEESMLVLALMYRLWYGGSKYMDNFKRAIKENEGDRWVAWVRSKTGKEGYTLASIKRKGREYDYHIEGDGLPPMVIYIDLNEIAWVELRQGTKKEFYEREPIDRGVVNVAPLYGAQSIELYVVKMDGGTNCTRVPNCLDENGHSLLIECPDTHPVNRLRSGNSLYTLTKNAGTVHRCWTNANPFALLLCADGTDDGRVTHVLFRHHDRTEDTIWGRHKKDNAPKDVPDYAIVPIEGSSLRIGSEKDALCVLWSLLSAQDVESIASLSDQLSMLLGTYDGVFLYDTCLYGTLFAHAHDAASRRHLAPRRHPLEPTVPKTVRLPAHGPGGGSRGSDVPAEDPDDGFFGGRVGKKTEGKKWPDHEAPRRPPPDPLVYRWSVLPDGGELRMAATVNQQPRTDVTDYWLDTRPFECRLSSVWRSRDRVAARLGGVQKGGGGVTADDVLRGERNLAVLALEHGLGFPVSSQQKACAERLVKAVLSGKGLRSVEQLLMGMGKSSVVLPLAALLLMLRRQKSTFVVVPMHLLHATAGHLARHLGPMMHPVHGCMRRVPRGSRSNPGLTMPWYTPTEVEQYGLVVQDDLEFKRMHLQYGVTVPYAVREAAVLIDEVDSLYRPGTSTLSYPGSRGSVDLTGIPPELLDHIASVVFDPTAEATLSMEQAQYSVTPLGRLTYETNRLLVNQQDCVRLRDYGWSRADADLLEAVPYARAHVPVEGSRFSDTLVQMVCTARMHSGGGDVDWPRIVGGAYTYLVSYARRMYTRTKKQTSLIWQLLFPDGMYDQVVADKVLFDEKSTGLAVLTSFVIGSSADVQRTFRYKVLRDVVLASMTAPSHALQVSFLEAIEQHQHAAGFSGTAHMILPYGGSNIVPMAKSIEQRVLDIFGQKTVVYRWSFLKDVVRSKVDVLVDAGAFLLDTTAQDVAVAILSVALDTTTSVVYADEETGGFMRLRRGSMTPESYDRTADAGAFLYYDHGRTVGTDLPQPAKLRGVVTVGADACLSDVIQAAFRLRRAGRGHTVAFALHAGVPPTIKTGPDLLSFLRENEATRYEQREEPMRVMQNARSERKATYTEESFNLGRYLESIKGDHAALTATFGTDPRISFFMGGLHPVKNPTLRESIKRLVQRANTLVIGRATTREEALQRSTDTAAPPVTITPIKPVGCPNNLRGDLQGTNAWVKTMTAAGVTFAEGVDIYAFMQPCPNLILPSEPDLFNKHTKDYDVRWEKYSPNVCYDQDMQKMANAARSWYYRVVAPSGPGTTAWTSLLVVTPPTREDVSTTEDSHPFLDWVAGIPQSVREHVRALQEARLRFGNEGFKSAAHVLSCLAAVRSYERQHDLDIVRNYFESFKSHQEYVTFLQADPKYGRVMRRFYPSMPYSSAMEASLAAEIVA
jgi:hypothetical protein